MKGWGRGAEEGKAKLLLTLLVGNTVREGRGGDGVLGVEWGEDRELGTRGKGK